MYGKLKDFLTSELESIKAAGLYKNERIITTPQRADIKVNAGSDVLNFCANNYLGLSDNSRLIQAAKEAMDQGFTKYTPSSGMPALKKADTATPAKIMRTGLMPFFQARI